MAYGGAPNGSNTDTVRLLVGDISTSTSGEWLTNTDYSYFLTASPNAYLAAKLAANSLAALFAGPSGVGEDWIERKVGDLTIKRSEATALANGFLELGEEFALRAAAGVSPSAGGISLSQKAELEGDADRVRPAFIRYLFDNPSATDMARASVST